MEGRFFRKNLLSVNFFNFSSILFSICMHFFQIRQILALQQQQAQQQQQQQHPQQQQQVWNQKL